LEFEIFDHRPAPRRDNHEKGNFSKFSLLVAHSLVRHRSIDGGNTLPLAVTPPYVSFSAAAAAAPAAAH